MEVDSLSTSCVKNSASHSQGLVGINMSDLHAHGLVLQLLACELKVIVL